jgi:hypothetical protein
VLGLGAQPLAPAPGHAAAAAWQGDLLALWCAASCSPWLRGCAPRAAALQRQAHLPGCLAEVELRPDLDPQLPAQQRAELLQQWQQLLGQANPAARMDPATGALLVQLAKPAASTLEILVMTEGWQMTRSNFGSVALLQAVA